MVREMWRGVVLAESTETVVIEGNHYFPRDSARWEHLKPSAHTSFCSSKGTATYYDIVVGGEVNAAAVWCYPSPKLAAEAIRGRLAFWRGVSVESVPGDAVSERRSSGRGQNANAYR